MLRLLVVDDEAVHLMNLIGSIQTIRPSYIIFSARDGSQALDMMKAFQIDALITTDEEEQRYYHYIDNFARMGGDMVTIGYAVSFVF